ncbi:hypothetical protein SLEP1_g58748 [Rubroshorea leprosula]|uniref:Uncharacterized protein n=1 Tax=Rubroshorea leprosula TaxID=152421 RepID=A0AAV5MRJ6_9ROSI|nr:hypothetical protein SLEP1_g58748 [Rubroshorea leprosula]
MNTHEQTWFRTDSAVSKAYVAASRAQVHLPSPNASVLSIVRTFELLPRHYNPNPILETQAPFPADRSTGFTNTTASPSAIESCNGLSSWLPLVPPLLLNPVQSILSHSSH